MKICKGKIKRKGDKIMGDTNLHLGDIKIKNADTGQEIKINGPLKFNFDNKNFLQP